MNSDVPKLTKRAIRVYGLADLLLYRKASLLEGDKESKVKVKQSRGNDESMRKGNKIMKIK